MGSLGIWGLFGRIGGGGLILAEDIWVGRIKRKSMGESELDKNLVKMMEVGCSVCRDRRMKKKD